MSEELKPCPFCGGKAVLLGGPQAQECHSAWCTECSAKMYGGMNAAPLVAKWNARPAQVQVPEGWRIERKGDAMLVEKHGLGGCMVWQDSDEVRGIPGTILWELASDMLAAAPSAPAAPAVDAEKVMALVEEYGILRYRLACIGERNHASLAARADARKAEIRALLASPARQGCDYHAVAQLLYGLLDDIDTAGDMAKADDAAYRKLVESIQARKREVVAECDGYTVTFKTPAIANQEARDGR